MSLSGYRIVQEALSNAMRHAPGSVVEIAIGYEERPPAVRLRVENSPAPGGAAVRERPGTQHGLVGMRERAAMVHGELTAGPTPDGGFAVVASLPLADE